MTSQELFTYLTQDAGFDDTITKVIMDQVAKNEKVATRAVGLKQQSDLDKIQQKADELTERLNGKDGKPGAKSYEDWYQKNFPAIQQLQAQVVKYQEKYGALDSTQQPQQAQQTQQSTPFTKEDVDRMFQEKWDAVTPQLSNTLVAATKITERHVRGRKTPLDWDKIQELARTKTNGNLEAAYDEWDAPEREKQAKESTELEVKRRVDEELAKRNTQTFFPAGADATPSGSSGLSRPASDKKYDRNSVIAAAVTGHYDGKPAAATN